MGSTDRDRLAGQVAVISGGSAGIGRRTAELFAEHGARVVSVDLRAPRKPLVAGRHIEADVSDFAAVERCVNEVLATEGAIDCLINNAGVSSDAVLWKMSEAEWDRVLAVNLKGAFNFVRHVAPHMKQRGRGKIVNVSSINGLRGKRGLVNYASAKAGLIGLTKTVAKELGRYNVNVNAVAPGLVKTELTSALPARFIDEALQESVLGRLSEPEDVAQAVLFLCSEQARQITGEVIRIDGGQYI